MVLRKTLKNAIVILLMVTAAGMAFARGGQAASPTPAAGNNLLVGIQSNSLVADYKNNHLTRYLEKLNGITIDFYMLPASNSEAATKLALMISSGDLPDTLLTDSLGAEQIFAYGASGVLLSLNNYVNDPAKAPNLVKVPEPERTSLLRASTSADGKIYSLPRWERELWNMTAHRIYINKSWVDKLGLTIPKTTDELRNVLAAFRDRDPNGNGKKDEIGVYGWFGGNYGENTISALINSFIFFNMGHLSLDSAGTKVTAPFTDPAFRKALVYLNGLFKDGMLAASLFTDNQQQFRATLNTEPNIVSLTSAGSFSNWPQYATSNMNFREMAVIEPLTGPDGVSWTPYSEYDPTQSGFIPAQSRNPDLAMKFLDCFFNYDVSLTARYGEEGVDWSRQPEDLAQTSNIYVEMGMFPSLSIAQKSTIWSTPSSQFWHNMHPRWAPDEESLRKGDMLVPFEPDLPHIPWYVANYTYYRNRHPDKVLPTLRYTLDDASKNAEVITNVNDYVGQAIAEFVTGVRDINNNAAWDSYLQELNNMGLQGWLTRAQATYDRIK